MDLNAVHVGGDALGQAVLGIVRVRHVVLWNVAEAQPRRQVDHLVQQEAGLAGGLVAQRRKVQAVQVQRAEARRDRARHHPVVGIAADELGRTVDLEVEPAIAVPGEARRRGRRHTTVREVGRPRRGHRRQCGFGVRGARAERGEGSEEDHPHGDDQDRQPAGSCNQGNASSAAPILARSRRSSADQGAEVAFKGLIREAVA
jgi:hypothetical protein